MKVEITKEELREIIRIFFIGILAEDSFLEEKDRKENEEERVKDNNNLLLKLKFEAEKNKVKIDFFDKAIDNLEEDTIKAMKLLIENRKRTYTSKYWDFIGK